MAPQRYALGTYRLFLAFCVLYSHVFGEFLGWNIGVVAVISFFVMSGYVMAILLHKHYPAPENILAFYKDRAARIFPQYTLYLLMTLLFIAVLDLSDNYWQERDPIYIVLNALILPLGYYMFGLSNALYVPPAWSLGLEMTFYLFVPFFWQSSKSLKYLVIGLSLAVFAAAVAGIIHTDRFGYRLLPGTFFIFATGIALAKPERMPLNLPISSFIAALIALVVTLSTPGLYSTNYNKEVAAGIIFSVLAVTFLRGFRFSQFDELMGNLSYGVFLNHFLVMSVCVNFGIDKITVPFISLAMSAVSYVIVEQPAIR